MKFTAPEAPRARTSWPLARPTPVRSTATTLRTLDPQAEFVTPRPIPVPANWQVARRRVRAATASSGRRSTSGTATAASSFSPGRTASSIGPTSASAPTRRSPSPATSATPTVNRSQARRSRSTGTQLPHITTTDATGFYSFAEIIRGQYTATATGGGCDGIHTLEVEIRRPTTLDFTLPRKTDAFGYSCELVEAPFQEAANPLTLTGDDVSVAVPLPFPFEFYGEKLHDGLCDVRTATSNFLSLSSSFSNLSIPNGGLPNSAINQSGTTCSSTPSRACGPSCSAPRPTARFVVEWRNVRFFGDTTRRVDFNIVLHENGEILTQHRNRADDGRELGDSATLGIENTAGYGRAPVLVQPGRARGRACNHLDPVRAAGLEQAASREGPAPVGP